jgi:2-methylcitrate dehydratase PrpD
MNGVIAAKLAQKGFSSSKQVIESPKGFANVLSTAPDFSQMTSGLGQEFEILKNCYKPFACGVVAHPAIDAMIRAREKYNLKSCQIESVECVVHPFVPVPMGRKTPKTGLEAKFSTYHCVAVALIDGIAGQGQFSDARVIDDEVTNLRGKIILTPNSDIQSDEAIIMIRLTDGQVLREHVRYAIGCLNNPMSDEQLIRKFLGIAGLVLPDKKINRLLQLMWDFENLPNLEEVIENVYP